MTNKGSIFESSVMNAEETIEIASDYSKRHGYDPRQYNATTERVNNEWHVFFQGKELRPGNFFSVYIDDEERKVKELVPGK